jgi:hypothetical protein
VILCTRLATAEAERDIRLGTSRRLNLEKPDRGAVMRCGAAERGRAWPSKQSGVAGDCSRGGAVFLNSSATTMVRFLLLAFALAVSRGIGIDGALLTVSCGRGIDRGKWMSPEGERPIRCSVVAGIEDCGP